MPEFDLTNFTPTGHGNRKLSHWYKEEYAIYCGAKSRCSNPKATDYPHYGGKGIEFRFSSFEEFLKTVGPRPSKKHSIDRIRSNEHYEAGNIRWATKREQMNNRSNTRYVTFRRRTQPLADWAHELGIKRIILYRRLYVYHWSIERSFTTPVPE